MDRRSFILNSTTAGIAMFSTTAKASVESALPPANVIHTQNNAGKWAAKKESHLPKIEINAGKVKISTDHDQSKNHYIVRHRLLLADGGVVGAKTFSPDNDPVSEYELPADYRGIIYATSFCNKHDLWLSEFLI
jgi:superoxide reductase